MSNKHLDGIRATATKVAQYGPGELSRAGNQAVWTKRYPNEPRTENPYLRLEIYTPMGTRTGEALPGVEGRKPREARLRKSILLEVIVMTRCLPLFGNLNAKLGQMKNG
jgi:hypothetical protein